MDNIINLQDIAKFTPKNEENVKKVCNLCGKEFDMFDDNEDFFTQQHLSYGTKYDGEFLDINFCCQCMENIIDSCVISPLGE